MATLNQIADRIAYSLNDPFNYQLKENIKFSVKTWRAFLIRQDILRNGLSDEFLQRFYVDLVKVDKADACNFDLNCLILRTKFEVPKPIRLNNDILFKFVGTVDGKPFTYVEYEEVAYTAYTKFSTNLIRYNYTNGYLYIFGNTKLKKLAIQAVFVNPEEINNSCDEETCYKDDKEFPISEDMIKIIISGIMSGEFKIQPKDEEVTIEADTTK